MSEGPQEMEIRPMRRGMLGQISAVWLIPIAALAISLFVAWQNYTDRGPIITVQFANGSGIKAGQTELRYRDVRVGVVEGVKFTPDLQHVLVDIRLDKEVARFVDDSSQFWVVRPEVSTRGVTGLDTVLTGIFIEGSWDSQIGAARARFEGLENPPVARADQEGLAIVLTAPNSASLSAGAPILYRGIEVGNIENPRLTETGDAVEADAFIRAPYHRLLTTASAFWNASGFDVSLGPGGLKLDVASLSSLISGGISFDTTISGGRAVEAGTRFTVYADEATAHSSLSGEGGDLEGLPVTISFPESVAGLAAGAAVEYRGIPVGNVTNINAYIEDPDAAQPVVRLRVTATVLHAKMGLSGEQTDAAIYDFLAERVDQGMRARLATANLLTGGLKIELVDLEDAAPAEMDRDAEPYPELPSVAAEIDNIAANAEGVFTRLQNLPVEDLMQSAIALLNNANVLISSSDLRETPAELKGLIGDVRGVVGSDSVKALPDKLAVILADIEATTGATREILQTLQEEKAAAALVSALKSAESSAAGISAASESLPGIVEDIAGLAESANALPLGEISAQLQGILADLKKVSGSDALAALPGGAEAALDELRAAVAAVNAQLEVLGEAKAGASLAAALTSVEAATEDLPDLVARLDTLAASANKVPLGDLSGQLQGILADLKTISGSEATQALPGKLDGAVGELAAAVSDVRGVVATLTEADAAGALVGALDAAQAAAENISTATKGLPDLVKKIDAVAAEAASLPLEELVTQLTDLVETADGVIGAEGAAEVPAALRDALREMDAILSELRAGGTTENVNAALASARGAADAVAAASGDLPALVARLNALVSQASATLATYSGRAPIPREAEAALRDVRAAAEAVESLARTIERNPNSLLLGR